MSKIACILECVYGAGGKIFYSEETHLILMTIHPFLYIVSLVIQLSDLTLTVSRPRD
jgi:hypothetical protein